MSRVIYALNCFGLVLLIEQIKKNTVKTCQPEQNTGKKHLCKAQVLLVMVLPDSLDEKLQYVVGGSHTTVKCYIGVFMGLSRD